jgi:hypothetical protein
MNKSITVPVKNAPKGAAWSVSWEQHVEPEVRSCKCPICGRKSVYKKEKKTPIPWCGKCMVKAFRKIGLRRMKDAGPIKKSKT